MMPPSDVNSSHGVPHRPDPARDILHSRPVPLHPAGGPLVPAALSAAPNALSLLKALRRRLVLALTLGLILAAIAGIVTWFLLPPPKITARTQLHVAASPPNILFPDESRSNHDVFLRSQAYLIKDRFVLNAALRSPEVAELGLIKEQSDPVQWLEKEIKVEFPSPEFVHISLAGDRPDELLRLVSAVTQSYLDGVVNKEHNTRHARLEDLKKVLGRFEERNRNKRATLRQLQEENGALNEKSMAILQQVALEDLHGVKKDLTQVRHDLRHLQVELGMRPDWVESIWPQYAAGLNCLPGMELPINHAIVALLHDDVIIALGASGARGQRAAHELDELLNGDKVVAEGLKQIRALQAELERMREVVREEAFETSSASLRHRLAVLEKEVEARRQQLRPIFLEKHREELRREALGNRREMQEKYVTLKELERVLLGEAARLADETKQIRKHAVDLAQLKEDIEKDEKVMQRAADKINAMEVEQEAPARISQPNKEAILVTKDEAKRKLMATGGAASGTLALVLLAFAWFEFQSRKIHSPEEVVEGLGLRLVGTVPDHSRRGWLEWLRPDEGNTAYSQSMLTESVDSARTMLLHTANAEKLQIVMITSALAGEGKTSLASHLAASLARAGRRTLLLDSDLRNPTLHRLFDRSRAPGLSELLRGEVDLAGAIRDTPIPNLWLISAGLADPVALQALALDSIPQIFQQLRTQYDFIVVDSCPVLPVADSLLVGQHVDAVIFSLLRQVSRLPRVYAAYQRLAVLGIRMLGAVVNGTHDDSYPADYRYVSPEH